MREADLVVNRLFSYSGLKFYWNDLQRVVEDFLLWMNFELGYTAKKLFKKIDLFHFCAIMKIIFRAG